MTKEQEILAKLKDFEFQEDRDGNNPNLELTLEEVKILNNFLDYIV